jgi:hypothetical protein
MRPMAPHRRSVSLPAGVGVILAIDTNRAHNRDSAYLPNR